MWPKPKQITRRWEAVATGRSYCRTAGVPEVREDEAQAKATRPEVRGSVDGTLMLPHGEDVWAGTRGGEHVAQAKANHPEMGGSGDGSLILTHGRGFPEVREDVAQAKVARSEVRGSGDGSLILPHGGDGWA